MVFSLVLGFNHTFWVVASFKPHTLNSQALMIKKNNKKLIFYLKEYQHDLTTLWKGHFLFPRNVAWTLSAHWCRATRIKHLIFISMFSSLTTSASQLCILRTPKIAEITVRVTGRQFTCFLHASRADCRFARSTSPVTVFPRGHTAMTCYWEATISITKLKVSF